MVTTSRGGEKKSVGSWIRFKIGLITLVDLLNIDFKRNWISLWLGSALLVRSVLKIFPNYK